MTKRHSFYIILLSNKFLQLTTQKKMKKAMYRIGQKFIRKQGMNNNIETIIDIFTTTNYQGKIIHIEYLTEQYRLGQKILGKALNSTITLSQLL